MPQEQPDIAKLLENLESVLGKIQERIAVAHSPEHKFALIHLVENISLEEWQDIASRMGLHGWLALPIDSKGGVPLESLRSTMEELSYQRDHDFLTGLANRRLLYSLADLEVRRALRTDTPLSVVMIDIDNFKEVNDTYGHPVGDKVLKVLAGLMAKSLRVYDIAARMGGDEFCLLLPGASSQQAADLAKRILEDFKAIKFETYGLGSFSCTFSTGIGSSKSATGMDSIERLFCQADDLLYKAKYLGKNMVCTVDSRLNISESPALVQAVEKQFLFTGKFAL